MIGKDIACQGQMGHEIRDGRAKPEQTYAREGRQDRTKKDKGEIRASAGPVRGKG